MTTKPDSAPARVFTGNSSGAEPTKTGSGPDGASCKASGIVHR